MALRLEPCLSTFVLVELLLMIVARPLELDHEPSSWAVEIDHVVADGMLPTELPPVHLPTLQATPQNPLGEGHPLAQLSRTFGSGGWHRCRIWSKGARCNPACKGTAYHHGPSGASRHLPAMRGGQCLDPRPLR